MKLIGIVVGAALLTAAPFSVHCTPKKAGLYVDRADARVVHRRRQSYGYYDVPYYGALAYPRSITPASHPTASCPIPIQSVRQLGAFSWDLSDCLT
jgi:hypothetical protein